MGAKGKKKSSTSKTTKAQPPVNDRSNQDHQESSVPARSGLITSTEATTTTFVGDAIPATLTSWWTFGAKDADETPASGLQRESSLFRSTARKPVGGVLEFDRTRETLGLVDEARNRLRGRHETASDHETKIDEAGNDAWGVQSVDEANDKPMKRKSKNKKDQGKEKRVVDRVTTAALSTSKISETSRRAELSASTTSHASSSSSPSTATATATADAILSTEEDRLQRTVFLANVPVAGKPREIGRFLCQCFESSSARSIWQRDDRLRELRDSLGEDVKLVVESVRLRSLAPSKIMKGSHQRKTAHRLAAIQPESFRHSSRSSCHAYCVVSPLPFPVEVLSSWSAGEATAKLVIASVRAQLLAASGEVPSISMSPGPLRSSLSSLSSSRGERSKVQIEMVHHPILLDGHHIFADAASAPGETARKFDPRRTCFLGSLPIDVEEETLYAHMSQVGCVLNIRLIRDADLGVGKGIGYVEYLDPTMGSAAIQSLNGSEYGGRKMRVERCVRKIKESKMKTEPRGPAKNDASRGFQRREERRSMKKRSAEAIDENGSEDQPAVKKHQDAGREDLSRSLRKIAVEASGILKAKGTGRRAKSAKKQEKKAAKIDRKSRRNQQKRN